MPDTAADARYGRGGMAWHATLVIAATLVSRLLGVVRHSVIAAQFGTSDAYAAYVQAFRVPDTIYQVIIGGALGSAFIPVFTAYLARRDDEGAWRLASTVFNLALIAAVGIAGLAFLLAPWLIRWLIAPGFSPDLQAQTVRLVRPLLLQPILLGLGGLAMAVLNSFRRFLLTSLAPLAYNLGIIAGALFLAPRWGVDGLVAGVLAGAVLYLLVMLPGLLLCRMRYSRSVDWREAGVREVGRLLGPRLLGQMFFYLNFVASGFLASFRGGLAVNALDYGYRLLFMPLGVLGVSLAQVVFPTLAELANQQRLTEFRSTLSRMLRVVLFLSLPVTSLLFTLRVPVIRILFERGEFTAADTAASAQVFVFYILELTAAIMLEIGVRAFYALHDTRTPVIVGGGAFVLNVVLGISLLPLMDYPALALSFSLATTAQAGVILFFLRQRIQGLDGMALLWSGIRSLGAALLAAVVVALVMPWIEGILPGEGLIAQFLRLAALGLLGGGLYLVAAVVLRCPELREAWALLRRRLRPGGQDRA